MVNPLFLFAASLGVGFLLPLIDKLGRRLSLGAIAAVMAAWAGLALSWLLALGSGASPAIFGTAGFNAPLAITLRAGGEEALLVLAIALVGLLSTLALRRAFLKCQVGGLMAFLMVVMGLSGIVLTRDLFNLFVFLEISSIATYALLGFDDRRSVMGPAFKYMMAGGIASSLYLIGVIYVYRFGGQLNLDALVGSPGLAGKAGSLALLFLLSALLLELKPFPANGWAIDVYEAANPGVAALLSGASATALLAALWKILPLLGRGHLALVAGGGLLTFVLSNLVAARQSGTRRMLGYSSAAQVGLVAASIALSSLMGLSSPAILGIAGGLLLNHLLAKTGLFLLAGALGEDEGGDKPALSAPSLAAAGVLATALVGLPPFPGFWAKWEFVRVLVAGGEWWIIALVLGGSLVEAFYVLRWFGALAKRGSELPAAERRVARLGLDGLGPLVLALALLGLGLLSGWRAGVREPLLYASLAAALALFLLDRLPGWLKALLSIAVFGLFAYLAWDRLDGLRLFFALMLLGGGAIYAFASTYLPGPRRGLHPLLAATTLALAALLIAHSALELFFAWELMTVASWLLVLRGRGGEKAALSYLVFGLGGAFLLMLGLQLNGWGGGAPAGAALAAASPLGLGLIVLGLLMKLGALGLHIWLPGAYAEADDEISGFLSSSLSKAGVFVLLLAMAAFGSAGGVPSWAWRLLGWLGVGTALFGALYAVYQEDIKRTLAWSSMGQIGYIILALAMNEHSGWTTALYLALNHFLFKSMLFLAIAGVVLRTGTRNMYEMGGLIKKMPFSFLSVLIAIIALSGVPPLTGFGGKWLLYSALISKGWYLEAGVAFFSSAVAFLYLFRLIHTIFLGQPKVPFKAVREAPLALLIPQALLMLVLLAASAFPRLILDPIMGIVGGYFPASLRFVGTSLRSPLGYWDGTLSMVVTIAVFALCLVWMLLNLHNPQNVKQFNIVFAAERPLRPETTHFAWNFYAPYERALGFLTRSRAERGWASFGTGVGALGGAFRRLYTGNGQTYLLHVLLYVVSLYLLMGAL